MDSELNVADLMLLMKAPSKEFVYKICNEAFLYRSINVPEDIISQCADKLGAEASKIVKLLNTLKCLIRKVLYQDISDPKQIYMLLSDDLNKNLGELLSKILANALPKWKASVVKKQVSLPRLEDFDWRVDVKVSSDNISRMAMPTCIMQLKIQENQQESNMLPPLQSINLELSKETIDTMLDGLGKIRDQLSSVAGK